ncbi:hypothetical protein Plec18167_004470 [Paecilomyces lecythidis]|uniref:Phosphoribulokinase/uridine kinase domain-containing protein n=1 Tax=Paecilomyces lecythidis TaxID=3004212 RepID=A0ABR3XS25_9EURO
MEAEVAHLADTILSRARAHSKPRFLVAIAGAPGSGKTTTAKAVQRELQDRHIDTALLSMDGFHLPRAILDTLPNHEEAYTRRGAPWTFDVTGFLQFVRQLRDWADGHSPHGSAALTAPTFDHRTKDPVADGVVIPIDTQIVLLEGNYLLLNQDTWREIAPLVDLRVFIDVHLGVARDRLARRHVESGIEPSLEDGYRRVDSNDYLNGLEIQENLITPDVVVQSVEYP